MALTVEDGTGLANADSYVSVSAADTYHAAYGAPAAWTAANTATKEGALRLATQYLDAMYGSRWFGRRINQTMSLDWPRYGVTDSDGWEVVSTAVPHQVESATAYVALKVVQGDTLLPDVATAANVTSESVTVGPITTSKSFAGVKSAAKLYPMVDLLLSGLTGSAGALYRA